MSQKELNLRFVFERVQDEYEPEFTSLELMGIERETNLTDDEISALGEDVGQSDWWQVDRWVNIQELLGDPHVRFVDIDRA